MFGATPPVFDRFDADMARKKALANAKTAFVMAMLEDLLASPLPENQKSALRVTKTLKQTEDYLHDTFSGYISTEAATDEEMALHREVIEYLQLVHAGLKSFVDAHPTPHKKKLTEKEFFYVPE